MLRMNTFARRSIATGLGILLGAFMLPGSVGLAGAVSVPPGTQGLFGVSCATASNCVAVGDGSGIVSTDGGNSWATSPITAGSWASVSCSDANNCVAVGTTTNGSSGIIDATTNGGASWTQQFSTANDFFTSVSCRGGSCVAVGVGTSGSPNFTQSGGVAITTGGGAWSPEPSPPGATRLLSVSCVDASHCWATGANGTSVAQVFATADGGHTWSTQTLAPFSGQATQQDEPLGIVFPDAAHGYVTLNGGGCGGPGCSSRLGPGGGIEATSDGGAHWAVQEYIANGASSDAVACTDSLHCEVVGGEKAGAVIQTSSDGGAHWAQQGGDIAGDVLSDLTCPTGGTCIIVGRSGSTITSPAVVLANPGPGGPSLPTCTAGASSPAPSGIVSRLAGNDRDATSVAVSNATFPTAGTAKAVVLASDANYPDALAGTPLAVAKTAPLLLTPPSGLTATVSGEISRVAPKGSTVYILGGTTALAPAIDTQITALGDNPQRVSGSDRFGTAVAIAGVLNNPSVILEATGFAFPDALSAGAAAAKATGAVLLTNGSSQASATATYLSSHPGDTRTAVGGPAAAADPGATPLAGSDRFATAVLVAQHFFTNPGRLGFASGQAFPDALAGGSNVGKAAGPILLVPVCGGLPSSLANYLGSVKGSVSGGALYGGPLAVGDDVLAELEQAA